MVHSCESPSLQEWRKFVAWRLVYLLYLVITLLYLYHFYPTFQSIVMLQYRRSRSEFARVPIASGPWVGSQFLITISKCKVARNFRLDFRERIIIIHQSIVMMILRTNIFYYTNLWYEFTHWTRELSYVHIQNSRQSISPVTSSWIKMFFPFLKITVQILHKLRTFSWFFHLLKNYS